MRPSRISSNRFVLSLVGIWCGLRIKPARILSTRCEVMMYVRKSHSPSLGPLARYLAYFDDCQIHCYIGLGITYYQRATPGGLVFERPWALTLLAMPRTVGRSVSGAMAMFAAVLRRILGTSVGEVCNKYVYIYILPDQTSAQGRCNVPCAGTQEPRGGSLSPTISCHPSSRCREINDLFDVREWANRLKLCF